MNNEQISAAVRVVERATKNQGPIAALAAAGKWAEAADSASAYGLWGVWAACRDAAGLPSDNDAREQRVAALTAARKARFVK